MNGEPHEKTLCDVLQQAILFRGLSAAECQQLSQVAKVRHFAPGEVILRQGEDSRQLWVVLEGKCEVVRFKDEKHDARHSLVLAVLEPYSNFGEMSFFHPAPHSANVRAQTEVKALVIARSNYDQLIRMGNGAAYKLAYNAVESLADRLRRMDEWVAELADQNPPDAKVPEWSSFRDKLFSGWNL